MKSFKTVAVFDKFSPLKDKSFKLTFETPEIKGGERLEALQDLMGSNVLLYFSPFDVEPDEEIVIDKEAGAKSASKRQRDLFFVLWKAEGEPDTFNQFYEKQMDKIANFIKRKIDKAENPL